MKWLIGLQKIVIVISSILITVGLGISVVFRYVLKIDLFSIEELLLIPTFLLYFVGAAHGSYENSHIAADLTGTFVKSKKVQNFINASISLIILITCLIITYWNFQYLSWSFSEGGKTQGWGIPLFIPHGTVFIGFVLITFYTVINLISNIKTVVNYIK